MILIHRDGTATRASSWFARLRPGEVVPLQLDKRRPDVNVFRRYDSARGPVLVEMGAGPAAVDRALANLQSQSTPPRAM